MLNLAPLSPSDNALAALYRDPWIARVGHDHRPAGPVVHPDAQYIGAHVDGRFVGAFLVIESGWIEADLHALLTRKALPWCRELGRMAVAQIFRTRAHIQRLTALVIEGLESARNYAVRCGFRPEGFKPAAVVVGGELRGLFMLGLTRKDWEASA